MAGCTSHFLCAMTPVTRANLVHATTYHQKRMLPELGGSESLLVPIRKPLRWTPELADEELLARKKGGRRKQSSLFRL